MADPATPVAAQAAVIPAASVVPVPDKKVEPATPKDDAVGIIGAKRAEIKAREEAVSKLPLKTEPTPDKPADTNGAKPPEVKPPEVPAVDAELTAQAKRFGYSEDEIKEMGPAATKAAVRIALAKVAATPLPEKKEPIAPVAPAKPPEVPAADEFSGVLTKLRETYGADDPYTQAFEALHKRLVALGDDHSAAKKELSEVTGYITDATGKEAHKRFHAAVKSLGSEYAEVFGTKPMHKTDKRTKEYSAQVRLQTAMATLSSRYAASPETEDLAEDWDALAREVADSVAPEIAKKKNEAEKAKIEAEVRKKVEEEHANRIGMSTARPNGASHNSIDTRTDKQQALDALRETRERLGLKSRR